MKKVIFSVIVATLAISPALAGTPGSDNRVSAKLTGNTAAAYNDGLFGAVTCNETQHRKFDTVDCAIANPRPDLAGHTITNGWYSDFDGALGTITFTMNADGSGYSGKATY